MRLVWAVRSFFRRSRSRLRRFRSSSATDGTCTTLPGHDGDSTLTLTMTPVDFTKVITKSGNPVMMFMTGKIKAKGDLGLAANIANFFDIPKA